MERRLFCKLRIDDIRISKPPERAPTYEPKNTIMKKSTSVLLYILSGAVIVSAVGLSSCSKDDDEPKAKPQLSFAETEKTVKESDGAIEIQIVLDKAASEDITVSYELSGTAQDNETATQNSPGDYEIDEDQTHGEVEIEKGQTSAVIKINLYSDFAIEDGKSSTEDILEPEEIDIEITDVDGGDIEISNDDETTILVEQEDGMLVFLAWGVGEGENYTDVDMDMTLWSENAQSQLVLTNFAAARTSVAPPEFFFLPHVINDGDYGLSYTYWGGTEDEMNFEVTFAELVDMEFEDVEDADVFQATYTLANINKWDDDEEGTDRLLAQTFTKTGNDYSDFSEITVHGEGSRTGTHSPVTIKRQTTSNQAPSSTVMKMLRKK